MDELRVLAAERRRRILRLVWDDELSAGEIAAQFDVSWPAVSQHLRILLDAGFVTQRREGTHRFYRADHEALGALRALVEQQWRQDLADLKDLAEAEHAEASRDDDGSAAPRPDTDPTDPTDPRTEP